MLHNLRSANKKVVNCARKLGRIRTWQGESGGGSGSWTRAELPVLPWGACGQFAVYFIFNFTLAQRLRTVAASIRHACTLPCIPPIVMLHSVLLTARPLPVLSLCA